MKVEHRLEQRNTEISIPEIVPVISGTNVVYPSMIVPMIMENQKTIKLIDEAVTGDKIVGLFAQQPGIEESPPVNLYKVGTAASILRMFKMPDGSVRALVQGICRIGIIDFIQTEPYVKAKVGRIVERAEKTPELQALCQNILTAFQKIVSSAPNLPNELTVVAMNLPEPGSLADFVAAHINLSLPEQQEILETEDVKQRLVSCQVIN